MSRKRTQKEQTLIEKLDREIREIKSVTDNMTFDQMWAYIEMIALLKKIYSHLKYDHEFTKEQVEFLLEVERPILSISHYTLDYFKDIDFDEILDFSCFDMEDEYFPKDVDGDY